MTLGMRLEKAAGGQGRAHEHADREEKRTGHDRVGLLLLLL
jgi:hypothetical protein